MAQVTTQITIINRDDEILAALGLLPAEQIRQTTLDKVVLAPDEIRLALPLNVIEQLGLAQLLDAPLQPAAGQQQRRVFQDAKVWLGDRVGVFQCLELPDGAVPRLGMIPMQELGVKPDPQTAGLRFLPMEVGDTYYMAYGQRRVTLWD